MARIIRNPTSTAQQARLQQEKLRLMQERERLILRELENTKSSVPSESSMLTGTPLPSRRQYTVLSPGAQVGFQHGLDRVTRLLKQLDERSENIHQLTDTAIQVVNQVMAPQQLESGRDLSRSLVGIVDVPLDQLFVKSPLLKPLVGLGTCFKFVFYKRFSEFH